jgi:hypothetical protein
MKRAERKSWIPGFAGHDEWGVTVKRPPAQIKKSFCALFSKSAAYLTFF